MSRASMARSALLYGFDDMLDLGFQRMLSGMRIGDQAAHHRDALDELGQPLQEQQEEADEDQRFRRPLRQPAGAERLLVDLIRADEERQAGEDHHHRER